MKVSCFSLWFSPDVWWSSSSEMRFHSSLFLLVQTALTKEQNLQQQHSGGFGFHRFPSRRKSSCRTSWDKTLGWGLSPALAGRALIWDVWDEGFRAPGCTLTCPTFIHQHMWHCIPWKPHFRMKSLEVSLQKQNRSGGNMKNWCKQFMTVLYCFSLTWQSSTEIISLLALSCQKVLQIMRAVAHVMILNFFFFQNLLIVNLIMLFSCTINFQPVYNMYYNTTHLINVYTYIIY